MSNPLTHSIRLPLAPPSSTNGAPRVGLHQLDSLWFQLTGTLCNLTCTHCFISCSPSNHHFGFLDFDVVVRALEQSRSLGVKEYYFTGGEPFMHPRVIDVLACTLEIGPATVLTNGTLFRDEIVQRLMELRDGSIYSLELRVSIDGPDAQTNDRIRGEGSFDKAMAGVAKLVDAGFLPIITMAQTWDEERSPLVYQQMKDALLAIGYTRPRVKLLPSLKLGAEIARSRGYLEDERITPAMMEGYDASQLLCTSSRIVTDRGVHVCPILIEQPDALLAPDLQSATRQDFPLHHHACYTCWLHGAICSNNSNPEQPKSPVDR